MLAARLLVADMYALLLEEVESGRYSGEELALFRNDRMFYGRFLNPATRPYALHQFTENLSAAIGYTAAGREHPGRIIDLGCGLGMQSILFASMGASVLSIDLIDRFINLFRKRTRFYEERLGRRLDIEFVNANFRTLDISPYAERYDAIFSMSAFSQITPLDSTVAKVCRMLRGDARVFIWDQNPGFLLLPRITASRKTLPSPAALSREFGKHGFTTEILRGAGAVPHPLWRTGHLGLARAIDSAAKKHLVLSFSYLFGARRQDVNLKHG